jgi:hypothetical protein
MGTGNERGVVHVHNVNDGADDMAEGGPSLE